MSFFDMLGMFDPGDGPRGPRRDSGATDDDPVIVDVQADGDDHGETPSAGKGEPPKRGVPRLTPRPLPNGPSKGTKILIGVVLALVVVVGLFFGLSQFITDLMWYGQLGFQNVVWTQLGVKFGLWAAYAKLMRYERYGMILLLVLVATGVLGKPLTTVTEAAFDKLFVFAEWGYELIGIFG